MKNKNFYLFKKSIQKNSCHTTKKNTKLKSEIFTLNVR